MEPPGLFSSRYPERGSHYWYPDEAGGPGEKTRLTPGHRALPQLGITLSPAYAPEARGRSARAFRPRQDRLPQALARAGITEMAAAHRYRAERFLPAYTPRFAGSAPEVGTAFIPWGSTPLAEILCVHAERVVAHDHTGHEHRQRVPIPPDPHRFHYVKGTGRVHAYPEGTRAVVQGPRCLARSHVEGRLIETATDSRRRNDPPPRSGDRLIVHPRPTVHEIIRARG